MRTSRRSKARSYQVIQELEDLRRSRTLGKTRGVRKQGNRNVERSKGPETEKIRSDISGLNILV